MTDTLPESVRALLWDVAPESMDAERESARIFERVMTRGTLDAMRWLLATYDHARLRVFVESRGARCLPPRELAFWSNALEMEPPVASSPGGGRPVWAD